MSASSKQSHQLDNFNTIGSPRPIGSMPTAITNPVSQYSNIMNRRKSNNALSPGAPTQVNVNQIMRQPKDVLNKSEVLNP
jgi:hypothetical protein